MSYDQWNQEEQAAILKVSIPLEQGNVLRHKAQLVERMARAGLNPFGTGQCLTTKRRTVLLGTLRCLNPFGTGQCLTTEMLVSKN